LYGASLKEQFEQAGFVEICDENQTAATFDSLYTLFDEFIAFLQQNPAWAHKLHNAKERFIRRKERNIYSTDFFGFFDESKRKGRAQISFYYGVHFHEFICSSYPEFHQAPAIMSFLNACLEVQKPYASLFESVAAELGLRHFFSSEY